MASIWQRLTTRTGGGNADVEQRFDQNDLAEWFNFNGVSYPIMRGGNYSAQSKTESIANDFVGYTEGAYKASGAVFAVCMARMLIFTEMRFQYQQLNKGRPGDLFTKPELSIFEKPWPRGTTGELLARALQDTDLAGNHYILRETDRLRRLRPDWTDVILTAPPDSAVHSDIAGHIYKPGGTLNPELWKIYPIDGSQGTVAHWCPIPDPQAQYRGMSWLTPLMREIQSDKSATNHKQKFFENGASPQLAVAFKESVTPEQFEKFKKSMENAHAGVDNAYSTLYLGGGADVTVVGKDLRQLDFKATQGVGETRIAAAGRVPVQIAGFSEGMQGGFRNEGGFDAVREMFGSGTMRPLWRSLADAYSVLVPVIGGARLWFDDRDIAFLRRDQAELADLRVKEADAIAQFIMNGFTPESAVAAVVQNDLTQLTHTGLYSVQLQPPMPDGAPDANTPVDPNKPTDPKAPAQTPPGNGKQTPPPTQKGQAK